MVKVHRELLARLDEVRAVTLDTPYGFQENVPQMTEKIVDFFQTALQVTIDPIRFASYERASDLERTLFRQSIRSATYVCAGPGSPSYALTQWAPVGMAEDLGDVLDQGGVICFSSAAALTLGAYTAPIYEIYKAGADPYWLSGLNLTARAGLNCVVIPHFNNAEGGTHDTSCCYMGERRLRELESELPAATATLGIDEHTAVLIDLERRTLSVRGKSQAVWRLNGEHRILANASTTPLEDLRSTGPGLGAQVATTTNAPRVNVDEPRELGERVRAGGANSLEALATLVALAANGPSTHSNPAELVNGILTVRENARTTGDYEWADRLRDVLLGAGIDVNDSPHGTTWSARSEPSH